MIRLALTLFALIEVFVVSGCIDVEKVVTVKSDGSGTVTETVVLTKAALASLKETKAQIGKNRATKSKADDAADGFQLIDEKRLREAATKMGDGVTLISVKPVTRPKGEGYTAIYAFNDVRTLKLDENPMHSMVQIDIEKEKVEKPENIGFDFTRGSPARLVVKMPLPDPPGENPPATPTPGKPDDMGRQMLQQILKDMRLAISIRAEGMIAETDAEYHDDSRVTLLDIDFNKLLADQQRMKAVMTANPETFEKTKVLIREVQGMKIETKPVVTIKFE